MPLGERGEIAVKGPTLMLGYLGIPLDQSLDDDGFLRCSDGGYIDAEGRLYLGRAAQRHHQDRRGQCLAAGDRRGDPRLPGVKLSQTVGVPDDLLGELVVGCIVPHDGVSLDEDAIKAFAKQKLASYKVPRRVLFFAEDELKTTGSAKIKTDELRKLAAERLAAEG